jgi:anti-anti-sigma factor
MSVVLADMRGVPVARVDGLLDLTTVDDVAAAVHATVSNSDMGLVLDLTGTTHLDSAGLHFVFEVTRRLARRQQALRVVVAPGTLVEDLLLANDLGSYATVGTDLDEAVAALLAEAA